MRQPPTPFQKMRARRAQIAAQQKRQELARLAHNVANEQRRINAAIGSASTTTGQSCDE